MQTFKKYMLKIVPYRTIILVRYGTIFEGMEVQMGIIKGRSVFLSASIDALLARIVSRKHRESEVDTLTATQARILFYLWAKDEIPIHEISRITNLQKSTLTSILSKLEKAGHISFMPCQTDKRKTIVKVVNRNENLVELNKKIIDEVGEIFYKGFSEDEIALYQSFLIRTLDNLIECENEKK
ncbi:transcriptional regulator [Paenibacillus terrae HPL-003]|uniref:Transcriptional regulator n=1 Tax=Paenibacillus terrae (strain HPL-003) TaxID=985665 RepID=G7VQY6_PAETH|nr:MarR family transcriptional regulator [Paenibacillus terrae]AET61245.1 transcriptional regulator [Paenibacillus terrae HPL-003]